jgi:protein phosphatase
LELVSFKASKTYCQPVKPISPMQNEGVVLTAQQQLDDVLDIEDVIGKRIVETKLRGRVTIREENAIAALEVISRFAIDPKWLIYLPPTMSPSETSHNSDLLEHPLEAFTYFRKNSVKDLVCEQKHMGSRGVVIVGKNEEAITRKFGIADQGIGVCYTRTGRRFFDNTEIELKILLRINKALESANFWNTFNTDWVCLDCEIMPWSAKAQELIHEQYAAVGSSGRAALTPTIEMLEMAERNGLQVSDTLQKYKNRYEMILKYIDSYRNYCWQVNDINDYKVAPFHILTTENNLHINKNHIWHMETISNICSYDKDLLLATPFIVVNLSDTESEQKGIYWWEELTAKGGEGMVVKPLDFVSKSRHGLVQPALKCRGKEYLRIIYGPEYTASENLIRLKDRALASKRSLAIREFSLGIEGLDRFINSEPLRRVHECVFGVLALESEPVDPRL